jgi:hypothetical protein
MGESEKKLNVARSERKLCGNNVEIAGDEKFFVVVKLIYPI